MILTMKTASLIAAIDLEIARLEQAKALISGSIPARTKRKPRRPPKSVTVKKKRTMSEAGRAAIRAAQLRRWAAAKKAEKNGR